MTLVLPPSRMKLVLPPSRMEIAILGETLARLQVDLNLYGVKIYSVYILKIQEGEKFPTHLHGLGTVRTPEGALELITKIIGMEFHRDTEWFGEQCLQTSNDVHLHLGETTMAAAMGPNRDHSRYSILSFYTRVY